MLKQRIASALVLVPLAIAAAWLGHPWLTLFVALAVGLAAWEFGQLGRHLGHQVFPNLSAAIAVAFAVERGFAGGRYLGAVLAIGTIIATIWHVIRAHTGTRTEAWAITVFAGVFVGFLGSHLVALRALPDGLAWLATTVITVWVADTAAYLAGSRWGRRKLAPLISPGKTWEGSCAALFASLPFGAALAWSAGIGPTNGLAIGLIVGLLTPFADLAKSMLKREAGVKDSSNLIPGHGGGLDRVDTLLFAGALVYYYAVLIAL